MIKNSYMKTLNLELVFEDTTEDLSIKITVRKGGEVDIKTLPSLQDNKSDTGDSIAKDEQLTKKSAPKKKKSGGNYMDIEI